MIKRRRKPADGEQPARRLRIEMLESRLQFASDFAFLDVDVIPDPIYITTGIIEETRVVASVVGESLFGLVSPDDDKPRVPVVNRLGEAEQVSVYPLDGALGPQVASTTSAHRLLASGIQVKSGPIDSADGYVTSVDRLLAADILGSTIGLSRASIGWSDAEFGDINDFSIRESTVGTSGSPGWDDWSSAILPTDWLKEDPSRIEDSSLGSIAVGTLTTTRIPQSDAPLMVISGTENLSSKRTRAASIFFRPGLELGCSVSALMDEHVSHHAESQYFVTRTKPHETRTMEAAIRPIQHHQADRPVVLR
jgi:hypothetical protein